MFPILSFLLSGFFIFIQNAGSEYVQTQILEARQLYPFRAYKDIQLFHYTIPPQVSIASFQYKANGSFHCSPKPIAVYLQYGSYPVMSPHNSSFPRTFMIKRLYLNNITLHTDLVPVTLNVSNPLPGNWYAAAFLVENTERIAQKGLFTPCSGWLTTFVKLNISNNMMTLLFGSRLHQEINGHKMYRFFANNDSWSCEVKLNDCQQSVNGRCPVILKVRQRGLPSIDDYEEAGTCNCSAVDECSLKFVPSVNDWNYILVESLVDSSVKFELDLQEKACDNLIQASNSSIYLDSSNVTASSINLTEMGYDGLVLHQVYSSAHNTLSCGPYIQLIRISLSTNLAFEYSLPSEYEDAYPLILNITNSGPTFTSFEVLPTVDIGGTLVLEMAISPFMNLTHSNVSVVGCLAYGVRPELQEDSCESGMLLSVNSSSSGHRFTTAMVPFPEAGIWYFGLLPTCYVSEDGESSDAECETNTTSVFLRIRSSPCILGQCGEFGTCYQYVSGGFIFSTCNCIAGWRGWGCTDGSVAHTEAEMLLDVLLLTLSNLLFIPAIVLGVRRKYFTEAFVYFTTMVFSAFYHACDAEVYSFCLMRLGVLQFCDFYSAILSIWVTLIAMADLPTAPQSFTHMAGAIGVALGVEYDRTGLWVIVVPAGIGFLILVTSWASRCYRNRVCFPKKTVWLYCLLPGIALAMVGLVIYAFFETKDNYPYVHSAWHAIIALSVLFLLPKGKVKSEGTATVASSSNYIRVADTPSCVAPLQGSSAYEHLLAPTS